MQVGEGTFRPPYCHRNYASEFNAIIKIGEPYEGFDKGSAFLTPMMTGHGITGAGYKGASKAKGDAPERLSDNVRRVVWWLQVACGWLSSLTSTPCWW